MDNNKDESVEIGIDSMPLDVLGHIFDIYLLQSRSG